MRVLVKSTGITLLFLLVFQISFATSYYIHPKLGNDSNVGTSQKFPFQTLAKIQKIKLLPGDQVFLANGQLYSGTLIIKNQQGLLGHPIKVNSINWDNEKSFQNAVIDFKGQANGILLQDCNFIEVSNLQLTGNGYQIPDDSQKMRCGVLIDNVDQALMTGMSLNNLTIHDVFFENPFYERGTEEVKSANGTQKYGWGIRLTSHKPLNKIKNIEISNCTVTDVSHTGIKLTGLGKNITDVRVIGNRVYRSGGPGIQMSGVANVYVANNIVAHSGSNDDSRKWGRGSGLWTWDSSNILIEKNQFLYANGPGDSAGAHIDFNCDNVFIQYNLSAYNAGGFCEILGNNYNCAYRYNVSVNDGYRVKGKNGAFQEGKTLWLSGFVGEKQARKGPVNTYIYNNTIYCDSTILPKMALDNTSSSILIANNIFYTKNNIKMVLGDQYKPDTKTGLIAKNIIFENNLFSKASTWPAEALFSDNHPTIGNPDFVNVNQLNLINFTPQNTAVFKNKGTAVKEFPFNEKKLNFNLEMKQDILGKDIIGSPSIGAIQ
ncbi:right-handed parallel beta-helix repeat-containing protein [Pedobacter arcticus]|uniref:right-handed parallel beta-helix repeat-containing protein n=1 Tax=Pedobacter arcticus TaxID=752140 RepID=UPI0002F66978|nr:right-handed parallel beta-helix repeat-containing protein [Pedobacter arcticus]